MPDYYERNFGLTDKVPQAGDLFIDIGANEGAWALHFASKYREVLAFEPDNRARAALLYEILANEQAYHNVNLKAEAIWRESGKLELKIFSGHIHTAAAEIGVTVNDDNIHRVLITKIAADAVTLDAVMADWPANAYPVVTIKIDVEGGEYDVLLGARETLAERSPHLLIEVHSKDLKQKCLDYLHNFGYCCEIIRHPDYKSDHKYYDEHMWLNCHKKA